MQYQVNLKFIKEERLKRELTLQQMADKLGVKSKSDYFKRETGDTNFKPAELPVLAELFGVDLEKIFVKSFRKSKQEVS
ncbi:helix-turn-helix transcriptional regulator [Loigolactobacillus bifermentans]|jgi:transcriptional regulator with XRE-family HTH domain|uniref:HTH cro/C1-type domain-containing protein n=1 Tax=Loigolactobacillus bifermentans DSM 20003 TaxID=1423726 RepID=A0A0R1H364_9LACO|nr:helix-turn-helix transcriptional regulator [Loigolactobacillus bifermentans]KRK40847.1 hypothetical protein FC07_GL002599 [Loigolactobacillus bifermentans DSM 20003]QGG59600.1 helix-turn-helix domain-containing protein [Loigolactobacillus bifermentans]